MHEGMYYWKICVSGGHIFHEKYVLWADMCSRWAYLADLCRSNHFSCCEFRHLFFFPTVKFCLPSNMLFQEFIG